MTRPASNQQWRERAATYRSAPSAPLLALQRQYGVPKSTAARWVKVLRDRGHIPPAGKQGRYKPVITLTATCECGWTWTTDTSTRLSTALADHRRSFPSLRGKNQRSYCSTACRQAAANLERRRQRAAGQRRRSIPTSLRLRLAYQQEYRCWHCGILLNLSVTGAEDSLHIDHVIPVSKGGADTEDNLVASCARCNQTRGNWWTPQQLRAVSDAG